MSALERKAIIGPAERAFMLDVGVRNVAFALKTGATGAIENTLLQLATLQIDREEVLTHPDVMVLLGGE